MFPLSHIEWERSYVAERVHYAFLIQKDGDDGKEEKWNMGMDKSTRYRGYY